MGNNIQDKSNNYCTGCGACVVTCPVNAIYYKVNEEGFYQAFVDDEKCINCGKCKNVCAKFLKEEKYGIKLENGRVYSAQSNNANTVETCTSGGIAFEIAKYGIEHGYQIFGTIYDYKENIAKAIIAKTMEEIELLKGSKYIQSNTEEALRELVKKCKEDADAKFIVFGTPCQILGLSKMIEINNIKNEIIKIDLFCHGVPSYLVWENYRKQLKEKHGIKEIKNIMFRDKKFNWHKYYINIISKENSKYVNDSDNDIFYKAFLDNILLNNCCQKCEFRKNYSMADVRIGDFWGKRYSNREDGVSAILIINDKGKELINKIEKENRIKIIEETPTVECINAQSREDYKYQELRKKAFDELKYGENLQKVIKNYRRNMPLKAKLRYIVKHASKILPKTIRNKIKYSIRK